MSTDEQIISVTRTIEYVGSRSWIEKILHHSAIQPGKPFGYHIARDPYGMSGGGGINIAEIARTEEEIVS